MSSNFSRASLYAALCTTAVVYAMPAAAAQQRAFDIAAQPLASALTAYGRQADVQIFFPRATIAHVRSSALRGSMTPDAALARLIDGSGLTIKSDNGRTIVLGAVAPQPGTASAGRGMTEARRTAGVAGTVRSETGSLLAGAQVRIEGSDRVVATDGDGKFLLPSVPAGASRLIVTYFGLETQLVDIPVSGAIVVTLSSQAAAGTEIVVQGSRTIAESEEAAIQIKRASNALVDVVAADSIGRFPDQNIAAAIGRLPGVGLGRDQGQERYVSLRGAPTRWTTLSFDGVNVVGPEGRTARFDVIPATIASQVIVRKAVTPNMPGETVAGNVDIVTRSPFDYAGTRASVDLGYGFNDLGNGKQLNASGFLSHRFANDTLGVLVSATHYERDMVTDNFENEWEVAAEDQEAGREDRAWNVKAKNKLYRLNRSNTSVTGRLEWRPDAGNTVFLSSIFTRFRDKELRNSYNFDFDQGASSTATTPAGMTTGYGDIRSGNTPMQGVIYAGDIETSLNNSLTEQRIFTNTMGGNHQLGEWKANWRLNFTRADTHYKHPFQSNWAGADDALDRPAFVYDFTNPGFSRIGLYQTIRNADGTYGLGAERPALTGADQTFTSASRNDQLERTDAYTARLDLERHVSLFGADTLIQFGGEYDRRSKDFQRTLLNVNASDLIAAGVDLPTVDQIGTDTPYKGALPLAYSFRYFSADKTAALFDQWIEQGIAHTNAYDMEQNFYRVREQITAGYLMGTTYLPWGNIVYGARLEHVKNDGRAYVNFGSNDYRLVNTSSDTLMLFPSAHINWDINRNMKARLSFNTGAARPDYTNLRPNFSFSDTDEQVSGGNPDAKPERAMSVDAYFEWYMPSRGFFSAGVYYKKLDDILYDVDINEFGRDVLDSDGIVRSGYGYSTIANGGSGHIAGVEFSYVQPLEALALSAGLPDWMAGFGIRGTLTLNDTKAKTPDGRKTDLPGASDVIYNASVYYERYGFSARAAWQWQSGYLDSLGGNAMIGDAYWDNVGRLDVSARYNVNENLQLYVDANNLTDEPGIRYQGNRSRSIEYESFGRRYMAGVRLNF